MTSDPGLHNLGIVLVLVIAFGQLIADALHRCRCEFCGHCADERRRREQEQERLRRDL